MCGVCHGTSVVYYVEWSCPPTFIWVLKIEFRSTSLFNLCLLSLSTSPGCSCICYLQLEILRSLCPKGWGSQKHMTTVNPSKFYILNKYCLFKIMGQGIRDPSRVSGMACSKMLEGRNTLTLGCDTLKGIRF